MHLSRTLNRRAPSSAPATPKSDRIPDLGEYRLPFIMAQQSARARDRSELSITTGSREAASPLTSTAALPSSPITPKQSPLPLMPASPASGVAMSPTRKESYKDLITRAISSHPDKLMTLSDIYAWIVANVEAYRDQSHIPSTQGWKNAIRHTLSFYKCFKRVKRHPSIEKPSYWTIDYSEQQTGSATGTSSTPVPVATKSSGSSASSTPSSVGITAAAIQRPVPTLPSSTPAPKREIPEEQGKTLDVATSVHDLRTWAANWPVRSAASPSKEEQCIQGLLLFRTSAGFHFLPQSSGESRPQVSTAAITSQTVSTTLPKLPPTGAWTVGEHCSAVGDLLTYASSAQVYSRQEPTSDSTVYSHGLARYENGIKTPQTTSGGGSVTVVVDTLSGSTRAPLTSIWTTAAMTEHEMRDPALQGREHSPRQQRKPQLQKRYVESSSVTSMQQQQPPPKPESVSYVQLIANAILATPEKRATLAQIYEWLVANVAAFQGQGASPSSVGWKNAVRHTLSTRPFFKRVICEEAFGRQKPAWWTVDVEAMTLASSLRQQQQSQLKVTKRRRNGHTTVSESMSVRTEQEAAAILAVQALAQFYRFHSALTASIFSEPLTGSTSSAFSPGSDRGAVSVIHRVGEGSTVILEKATSESPVTHRAATEDLKWQGDASAGFEKEVVSSPEATIDRAATGFRFPSSSTTSTVSTCKAEMISPVSDIQKSERSIQHHQPSVENAVFESATGLDVDIFDCLLKDLTFHLGASWLSELPPRDALTLTLIRLRRQPPSSEQNQSNRQMRKLYVNWLALLSAQLSPLIVWPDSDTTCLPPTYLTDRLITLERMNHPENVLGVLDVFTLEVLFDHSDECCRKTINAVIIYNLEGAVLYRSKKLYWLGCARHAPAFQSGLRSMIENCIDRELKEKFATKSNSGRILLAYKNIDDILPRSVHVVRSKVVRNLLREKFGDRLLRFDVLAKQVMLKRKGSSAVTILSSMDEALTTCCGLLNLSPPIMWDDDNV